MADSIQWAIQNGDLDELKEILDANPGLTDCKNQQGKLPIHIAADYGQSAVVSELIKRGANVNSVDKYGITPTLAAIYERHKEVLRILLEEGKADIKDKKTPDGKSYMDVAETSEIKDMLSAYLEQS